MLMKFKYSNFNSVNKGDGLVLTDYMNVLQCLSQDIFPLVFNSLNAYMSNKRKTQFSFTQHGVVVGMLN